jgi:hypothetical protein
MGLVGMREIQGSMGTSSLVARLGRLCGLALFSLLFWQEREPWWDRAGQFQRE